MKSESVCRFWMVAKSADGNAYDNSEAAEQEAKKRAETTGEVWCVLMATKAFVRGTQPINELPLEERVLEAPADGGQ